MGLLSQCHRLNLQDWDLGDGAAVAAGLLRRIPLRVLVLLN